MTVLATGEQFRLRCAGAEAVVVEVGGGLRSYRAGGRDVVDGFAEREMASDARGQVLAPWPNRLDAGRYSWDGEEHVTPVTEPETGNAIHGLVRFAPWQVVDRSSDTVRLEHLLYPQPGYPFALRLSVAYELSPDGLRVRTTATNEGDVPLPYGEGHHPYLAAGAGLLVDDCTLTAPGATRLTTDERQLPTGSEPVEGTRYDLRAGRVVGDLRIDHCFTDLRTGRRRAGPGAAHRPRRARVGALAGRGVQPPAAVHRRRGGPGAAPAGLAVEPMTCPPNALATGESVIRLEPGESATGSWGITPLG